MTRFFNFFSGIACIGVGVLLTLDLGFHLGDQNKQVYDQCYFYFSCIFLVDILVRIVLLKKRKLYLVTHPADFFIATLFFPTILGGGLLIPDLIIQQFSLAMIMIGRITHVHFLMKWLRVKPVQTLLLGFIFAIFIGSLLLSLPVASKSATGISFVDAFFTATSSICVTGLVTLEISKTFTLFGQIIILILIQVGGLGILSFSALLAMFVKKAVSHQDSITLQESFSGVNTKQTKAIIKSIFKITFLVETIGAITLFLFWQHQFNSIQSAAFYSIFHAISAFCNAGFSLFSNSLTDFATQSTVILTLSALIIIGGLGFPVIFNLLQYKSTRKESLKLQTKMALYMTGILLSFGTIVIFILEFNNTLAHFDISDKLLISFFHSVSSRTAGFNSIDLAACMPATLLIIIILMYIGACPGSTGGGIKTTTFSIVFAGFWQTMQKRQHVSWGHRHISHSNILKALSIIILSSFVIATFFFLLLITENSTIFTILFETISAFGTTGLSLGLTSDLSNLGKGFIMVLMLIGRVGPLTIAFALSTKKEEPNVRYPEENVLIT